MSGFINSFFLLKKRLLVKLADFGLAFQFMENEMSQRDGMSACGSRAYMAPEFLIALLKGIELLTFSHWVSSYWRYVELC